MIRAFKINDIQALLALFDRNVPSYFDLSEREDFQRYLEKEVEDYYVIEYEGNIIGCGGINYNLVEMKAIISWDIIHPDYHGKGFGRKLIDYRLNHIQNNSNIKIIIVRTSQFTYEFYKKMGFELKETQKDFWAEGIDLFYMEQQCKRE